MSVFIHIFYLIVVACAWWSYFSTKNFIKVNDGSPNAFDIWKDYFGISVQPKKYVKFLLFMAILSTVGIFFIPDLLLRLWHLTDLQHN